MDEAGNAWSGLGSSIFLPSDLLAEIEKLKLSIRDVRLEHAKSITQLRLEVSELNKKIDSGEISHGHQPTDTDDQFNAFAYADPTEFGIGNSEEVERDMSHVVSVEGFVAPVPEGRSSLDDLEDEIIEGNWWEGLEDDGISFELANLVTNSIAENGCILNNTMKKKLYPELPITASIKTKLKNILAELDSISSIKIDKFRTLYYNSKEDPYEAYQRVYGKELTTEQSN